MHGARGEFGVFSFCLMQKRQPSPVLIFLKRSLILPC
ncbi:hypothetical protein [Pseudomonas cucumis]